MVVYIASKSPLPLVPFRTEDPGLNVTELDDHEEPVRRLFSLPHTAQAGSHTSCGCGFNEGRQYADDFNDPPELKADSLRSSAQLAQYVREHAVEEMFSCWSGDENVPKEFERSITPEDLVKLGFFFREGEFFKVLL